MSAIKDSKWKVVPLCDSQLLDVREEDILNDGAFRKYLGGGRVTSRVAAARHRAP